MVEEIQGEESKKELHPERYDESLFKQAYKAGLKAKEFKLEKKRQHRLRIIGLVICITIFSALAVFLSKILVFKSSSYIIAYKTEGSFNDIHDTVLPSSPSSSDFNYSLVGARSALFADLKTGEIFYAKNLDEQLYIASITKLMSAVVALKEFDLNEEVEVKRDWYDEDGMGWSLGFDKGDTVTVKTLLNAMLISSYNDSAYVLADHMDGGVDSFVEEMNNYSTKIGLKDTQFNNPSGLDTDGGNVSTVEDLYRLAVIVYDNGTLMEILSRSYGDLEWDIGSGRIYTTNSLMGKYGNVAGKTGFTKLSGECFLGITEDGKLTVVLDSDDRFGDTRKLLLNL